MVIYTAFFQIDGLLFKFEHPHPCFLSEFYLLLLVFFAGCMNDSPIDLPGMETIDLTDKEKLKESYALVENKVQNLVSFRPRKYKSYKVSLSICKFPFLLQMLELN